MLHWRSSWTCAGERGGAPPVDHFHAPNEGGIPDSKEQHKPAQGNAVGAMSPTHPCVLKERHISWHHQPRPSFAACSMLQRAATCEHHSGRFATAVCLQPSLPGENPTEQKNPAVITAGFLFKMLIDPVSGQPSYPSACWPPRRPCSAPRPTRNRQLEKPPPWFRPFRHGESRTTGHKRRRFPIL